MQGQQEHSRLPVRSCALRALPASTLVTDFQPPELGEKKCLLLKTSGLQYVVTAARAGSVFIPARCRSNSSAFNRPPVRSHLGHFQFQATTNNAVRVSLAQLDFLRLLPLLSPTLPLPLLAEHSCLNLARVT